MSTLTDERLMTTGDVARIAGVSVDTVRLWTQRGRLHAIRVGPHGRYRFRESEVRRLFASSQEDAA